jgi:hypothetical protein
MRKILKIQNNHQETLKKNQTVLILKGNLIKDKLFKH